MKHTPLVDAPSLYVIEESKNILIKIKNKFSTLFCLCLCTPLLFSFFFFLHTLTKPYIIISFCLKVKCKGFEYLILLLYSIKIHK